MSLTPQSEKRSSNFMYLMVEFPRVKTNDKEYSIVYYEKVFSSSEAWNNWMQLFVSCSRNCDGCFLFGLSGRRRHILRSYQLRHCQSSWPTDGHGERTHTKNDSILNSQYTDACLHYVSSQENLVESKHHKLARSLRSGPSDHDLKPNAATRDQLNVRNWKWSFNKVVWCWNLFCKRDLWDLEGLRAAALKTRLSVFSSLKAWSCCVQGSSGTWSWCWNKPTLGRFFTTAHLKLSQQWKNILWW